jgi:hypothetical protein
MEEAVVFVGAFAAHVTRHGQIADEQSAAGVQNWPGCAGGAGQSERRLLGLFRSKRSCLKTSPGLIMSGGGGIFRAP